MQPVASISSADTAPAPTTRIKLFILNSAETILMYAASLILHVQMINWVFALVFWFSLSTITIADRLGVRLVLRRLRIKGKNMRNILIVGSNDAAVQFARKIEQTPWLG